MNNKRFGEIKAAVKMMVKHMHGEKVAGLRVYEFPEPNVRAVRKAAGVSQAEFARLIWINVRTLQNWQQGRTRSTGVARALLIVRSDPQPAMKALHA